jgi:hypothetical protein
MKEIQPRSDGALWSHHLESWLVPDGTMLRLYDRSGRMRLTGMEAEAQQRQLEAQQKEAEARRADAAMQQAEFEAMRAEAAIQQAEVEALRAQTEAQRAEAAIQQAKALAEKLRSLGIDPDQLI